MARGAGVSLTYGTVVVSTSKQSKMLVPVDCPKSTRVAPDTALREFCSSVSASPRRVEGDPRWVYLPP
jgi:hypothetical protein